MRGCRSTLSAWRPYGGQWCEQCVSKEDRRKPIFGDNSVTRGLLASRFLDRFDCLFHNLRMKNSSGVKWDNHPACTFCVDSVATLRSQQEEASSEQRLLSLR